jgi:general secretion pathway protein E
MKDALIKLAPITLAKAREESLLSNRSFWEVLGDLSGYDQYDLVRAVGLLLNYQVIKLDDLNLMSPAFELLDYAHAHKMGVVVVKSKSGTPMIVFGDPYNVSLQNFFDEKIKVPITWCLAHPSHIHTYLARHEDSMNALDTVFEQEALNSNPSNQIQDLSIVSISEDTSPIVRLVHSTLYDALKMGSSDIHLESTNDGLLIRCRLDGVLSTVGKVDGVSTAEQVISRIKVVSELDISETRVPQDGRMKVSMRGREIDVRVSIMPSIFGEDAVLRILDKQTLTDQSHKLKLDTLGFDELTMRSLRKLASEPYGMLLVTGPTGSGKTTTLYAAITEIDQGDDKIITIEDPVEYQLAGILQIPVNEKKGLTFARGLRSVLRHDPDKIMIGEIRDTETAQIAIQSALTGHLVFTTVHANNVLDVIGRFTHMGIDLYSFVAAINGIFAQRLIRVICPNCKTSDEPSKELLDYSGLDNVDVSDFKFSVGKGCAHCRGTGFKGRKAIGELMTLNDELREMIINRSSARQIREAAARNGTRFLRENAIELVRSGDTTLREINRVTFIA